jgi:SAM-dependent methyltransferase
MDYIESFRNRADKFLYAVTKYPHVMEQELTTAYNMMNIKDNDSILNIPDGGIDIKSYIKHKNITYYGFETSPDFAKYGFNLCDYKNIPLSNDVIDKILVLANLHHVDLYDREQIYNEFKRILKKGGYLIIGDVIKNSKQDKWLNVFVNKWNSAGHKGIFFDENDSLLLEKCNYIVNIKKEKYKWIFNNKNEMIDFIINLFGLDLFEKYNDRNVIIKYINEYLDYFETDDKCGFSWELIYFIALNP